MKFLYPFLVFFIIYPILNMSAQTSGNNVATSETVKQNLVSINDNPGYKHLINRLKKVVERDGTSSTNHFFVAKYLADENTTYMVWREGRHLWILAVGGGDNPGYWRGVEFPRSGAYISFDEDVVDTIEQVGSSTYLVDQPWVNEKVFETVINGDLIVIQKDNKD